MEKEELARKMFILQGMMQSDAMKKVLEVSQGEMAMLGVLSNATEEMTPTALSKLLGLSTARVANTLNSLERKHYVERTHDTVDRRRVTVRVTEAGRALHEKTESEILSDTEELVEYLGMEDAEEYYRIQYRIYEFFRNKQEQQ